MLAVPSSLFRVGPAAVVMAAVTLAACETSVSPGGDHSMFFPTAVGSRWHYKTTFDFFHDTTYASPGFDWSNTVLAYTRYDTVSLSVVGQAALDSAGGLAAKWELSQRMDSLGFYYSSLWLKGGGRLEEGDTVAWYLTTAAKRPAFYFVAPLEDGQEWFCFDCETYFIDDFSSLWVDQTPILETPAGRFKDVYRFSHSFHGGDEAGGWISLYLADRVGIVKLTESTFSGGSPGGDIYTTLTWELEEYELK